MIFSTLNYPENIGKIIGKRKELFSFLTANPCYHFDLVFFLYKSLFNSRILVSKETGQSAFEIAILKCL